MEEKGHKYSTFSGFISFCPWGKRACPFHEAADGTKYVPFAFEKQF